MKEIEKRKHELFEEIKQVEVSLLNTREEVRQLDRRRESIEKTLHRILKPSILERDQHRCRACGSTQDLDLVRLYGEFPLELPERVEQYKKIHKEIIKRHPSWKGPPFVPIEKAYAEENLFVLCRRCHRIHDGLFSRGRRFRFNLERSGTLDVQKTVEFVRNKL